jgi:DNA-binding MarR family transcriptional regulator
VSRTPHSQHADAADSTGLVLWRVTLAWQREIRAALAPHDLTHVQFVLLATTWWLARDGGRPTQAEVAAHAGSDAMMTSQVLRKLMARGLLERVHDDRDARVRRVLPTAAGEDVLGPALADVEAVDARFFGALGSRRDAFTADLGRLAGDLREPPGGS